MVLEAASSSPAAASPPFHASHRVVEGDGNFSDGLACCRWYPCRVRIDVCVIQPGPQNPSKGNASRRFCGVRGSLADAALLRIAAGDLNVVK